MDGEKLLANIPEHTASQPLQPTPESMEMAGPDPDPTGEYEAHLKHLRRKVRHRRARLAFTLGLHLLGFVANIAVMVVLLLDGETKFLSMMAASWLVNAGVGTWIAWRDPEITFLRGLGIAGLPFLFLVYGVLQYVQIKHMFAVYKRRLDSSRGTTTRSEFHAKTFDGIIGGIPFAILCVWSFFLMDKEAQDCPWYLWDPDSWSKDHRDTQGHVQRTLYLVAGCMSIISLSMGILEVDYRVSESVRDAIDSSLQSTFLQWSYRVSEAASRIWGYALLCMVFEPPAVGLFGTMDMKSSFLMLFYPGVWVIIYYIILATSRTKGAKHDHFLAHFVMAFIMLFVNPFRFVDSPSFVKAARHINTSLWIARMVEFVVVLVIIGLAQVNGAEFPGACAWNRKAETIKLHPDFPPGCVCPSQHCLEGEPCIRCPEIDGEPCIVGTLVLNHILTTSKSLPVGWALTILFHGFMCSLGPFRIWKHFGTAGVLTDETVLDMIPAMSVDSGDSDGHAVAVRPRVAKGISSLVLRVGTGITNQLFADEEQAFGNFVIEKVLGRGAYGVVVLARMRTKRSGGGNSSLAPGSQDVVYAMKLQNTDTKRVKNTATGIMPTRGMTADREKEIMRKLSHPFIIRLAFFFEVPDRTLKEASSGDIIVDSNKNSRFHKAIVMEFCPGGDLDGHICKKAFPVGYKQLGRKMDASGAEWLQLSRRFSAEMCVAIAFLHEKDIVYRDLKPQNILLKSGPDNDVHICFTDFGFSKDVSGNESAAGRLDSLAGSPLYAAPEVMIIAQKQSRAEYTPSVDLYSLGRTICVMLWRVKIMDNPPELKMPSLKDCEGDARVHETALALMQKLTSPTPLQRGKAADLEHQAFFQEITLETGQVLPALTWAGLEKNAS